jgi:hypothetical protein
MITLAMKTSSETALKLLWWEKIARKPVSTEDANDVPVK